MEIKKILNFVAVSGVISVLLMTGCQVKNDNANNVTSMETDNLEDVRENTSSKSKIEEKENEKTEEMEKEVNSSEKRLVMVYYVDDQTGDVKGKSVEIADENDIWAALQDTGIITAECKLLNFTVDESSKKIDLDFDSATGDRIRSMGTTGETQIIGCIINTFLEAYNCDGIRLTENGVSLETSHGTNMDGYSGTISF